MNPKNYTSIETSKRLKELGIVQKSDVYHMRVNEGAKKDDFWFAPVSTPYQVNVDISGVHKPDNASFFHYENRELLSAYNCSELGAMLQNRVPRYVEMFSGFCYIESGGQRRCYDNLSTAAAEHLIDLLENKVYTVEAINERYLKYIEQ